MRSWFDSPFVLTCSVLIGALTLAIGIGLYRRGERWSLLTLLTVPAATLLGIYASDHHARPLGLVASALLIGGIGIRSVIRRRHANDGEQRVQA